MSVENSPHEVEKLGILSFLNSRREEIIEKQFYEITELKSKYSSLYEGAPAMLRTVNKEGIILDCNQTYATNLGYSNKEEVIGHSIFEHTPDEFMAAKRESFEEWRQTGKVKNKQVWFKRKDGTKFPCLISANNLYNSKGQFVGSNTVITDLTEIIEARRLKEKAAEEIKRAYQMRQEVLNIAAHELRTPIQPILGYVELFKKGLIEPAVAINSIQESAIRLRELADNLLVVGRIEGGNLSYDMQNMQAEPIIKELAKFARITIESLGKSEHVRVVTRFEPAVTAAQLCIDRGRILQAIENILNNSIKYTNKGEITIETCIIDDNQLFEIKISDTGPGIPPALLPRLFEKFATKAHDNPATPHKGTGLGLFITKSIIQAHGGEIFGYNNEGNNGATFVTRLPIPWESRPVHTGTAA